jgi:hypothetical protein
VSASEKPELHLRIGRLMLSQVVLPLDFDRVCATPDDELVTEMDQQPGSREQPVVAVSATLSPPRSLHSKSQPKAKASSHDQAGATKKRVSDASIVPWTSISQPPQHNTSLFSLSPSDSTIPKTEAEPGVVNYDSTALMDVIRHLNRYLSFLLCRLNLLRLLPTIPTLNTIWCMCSGQSLVTDPNERWSCAKLNCYLAHRTRDSTAFEAALTIALYAMMFAGPAVISPSSSPPSSTTSTSSVDSKMEQRNVAAAVASVDGRGDYFNEEDGQYNDDNADIMIRPSTIDSTIDSSMWNDPLRRPVLLRIYWLRLALEYACNRVNEGDAFATVALARCPSGIDRARLLCLCSKAAGYRTNYAPAIEYGLQALVAMNVYIPPRSAWEKRSHENQEAILSRVKDRNVQFVNNLPAISSPGELLTVKVINLLICCCLRCLPRDVALIGNFREYRSLPN